MMLAIAMLMACGAGADPALERMHDDPDWCPTTVDEVEATLNRFVCEHSLACGNAYSSQEACEDETRGQQPRPDDDVTCLDGCALRECILWREEHATDCAAGDPPGACSNWLVPCT